MHAAAKISYSLGLLSEDEMCRQERLLNRFGLPTAFKHSSVGWSNRHPDAGELLEIMKLDKKSRGGRIRFVLPKRIGEVFVTDKVPLSTIEKVLEGLKQ
jgi:3-dehydroquinate synthase